MIVTFFQKNEFKFKKKFRDVIHSLPRLLLRFRYPVALPEDIASALGTTLPNNLTFEEFIQRLSDPTFRSNRLIKFMSRQSAEEAFEKAQHKEHFPMNSLFSYYFHEGWLEFNLQFDNEARLRRLYLQHKKISSERGIEIPLAKGP